MIISYDVTDESTFENIRNWVDSLNSHAQVHTARILVGNKIDLVNDRKVTKENGE